MAQKNVNKFVTIKNFLHFCSFRNAWLLKDECSTLSFQLY